jgi:DnaJ-class molecular chaperone
MYQMGPGMYQQVQKACDTCRGEGEIIAEGGKCKSCQGRKTLVKEKTVEVPVDKGAFHGHAITLSGEGNEIVPFSLFSPTPWPETLSSSSRRSPMRHLPVRARIST